MGQIKNIKLHIVTDIKYLNRSIMGKPQRKKRTHKNIKDFKKSQRTRKRTTDIDEVHRHMEPDRINNYLHQKLDPDLPGEGQHYCIPCARYFISGTCLTEHKKTKNHKKRLRILKDSPYTQAEAEMAAGMGNYLVKKKKDLEQQASEKMMQDDEDDDEVEAGVKSVEKPPSPSPPIPSLSSSMDDIIDKMNMNYKLKTIN